MGICRYTTRMNQSASDINKTNIIQKLQDYLPSKAAVEIVRRTKIALLVGISGAGKDTIQHRLLEEFGADYHHIVSHTTRLPRLNHGILEHEGQEYYFINWQTVSQMIDDHAFIEANIYSDNLYGTSILEFEQAMEENKIAITDIEVQGVEEYVKLTSAIKLIFILPPSFEIWQKRLLGRYDGETEGHEDDLSRRMHRAAQELRFALDAGYFRFVVNDDLEKAVRDVNNIAHSKNPPDQTRAKQVAEALLAEIEKYIKEK